MEEDKELEGFVLGNEILFKSTSKRECKIYRIVDGALRHSANMRYYASGATSIEPVRDSGFLDDNERYFDLLRLAFANVQGDISNVPVAGIANTRVFKKYGGWELLSR
jgi:hypothetical protein